MRKALRNIEGKVYVYVSPYDSILSGPVRTLGTIDGTFDEPAGLVGLKAPADIADRIVNIRWSRKYERYGWTGSHTDCTSEPFVRFVLAPYIIEKTPAASATTAVARSNGPGPGEGLGVSGDALPSDFGAFSGR